MWYCYLGMVAMFLSCEYQILPVLIYFKIAGVVVTLLKLGE